MFTSNRSAASLIVGGFVLVAGGIAVASGTDHHSPDIEQHLERACHREVMSRSPHGRRELRTLGYDLVSSRVGIAKGDLKTKLVPDRWSQINWTCRVDPTSGRVLRVEFGWPTRAATGAGRLLAAASGF